MKIICLDCEASVVEEGEAVTVAINACPAHDQALFNPQQ